MVVHFLAFINSKRLSKWYFHERGKTLKSFEKENKIEVQLMHLPHLETGLLLENYFFSLWCILPNFVHTSTVEINKF